MISLLLPYVIASLAIIPGWAILIGENDVLRDSYDFVIVGGGTAGLVVANRLTEIPQFNVLVLEAGPIDAGVVELQVPFLCTHTTPQTPWDWNYTTIPQSALDGAALTYPRGHVLGGTSSVNCLVYTQGSQSDFDRFAQVTGDSGWSWNSQFDPAIHGFTGFNSVSLPGAPTAIDGRFNTAIQQLGGEFFQHVDYNSGNPLGFGWSQAVIVGPSGTRSSSSSGYLQKGILARPNLHVLVNAQVSRILNSNKKSSGLPVFNGVEYRLNGKGPLKSIIATKEIILSTGSINTPHILINSGIGSNKTLQTLGVATQVDLSDVGQNLSDHPIITLAWLVNANTTYDDFNRNVTLQNDELQVWNATRQGVFVNGIAQHIGFVRVPDNSTIFQSSPNPSSGPNSPHIEIFVSNFLLGNTPPTGEFLSVSAIMLTPGPAARGSVTPTSNDPFSVPSIDAGLMQDTTDLPLMREAVRSILRLVSAPAWSDYIIGAADPTQPSLTSSDEEFDTFIKANTRSAYHVVGTSSMSKKGAKSGVVDPNLLLKKVAGVCVVDASVLPFVPAGHTQASTYALAERAADLIKATFRN